MVCFEEFNRLFCKAIFKTALIVTINKLQEQTKQKNAGPQSKNPPEKKGQGLSLDLNYTHDSSSEATQMLSPGLEGSLTGSPIKRGVIISPQSPDQFSSALKKQEHFKHQGTDVSMKQTSSPNELKFDSTDSFINKVKRDDSRYILQKLKQTLRTEVYKRKEEHIKL